MKRLCLICVLLLQAIGTAKENLYDSAIIPFLKAKCVECHGGKKVKGDVDFTKIKTKEDVLKNFKLFESALQLINEGEMPPEDEPQASKEERKTFGHWYETTFVKNIVAQPAPFKSRRLSVTEYKNTLEDLFGFELEVAMGKAEETVSEKSLVRKILPNDPPGKSGFHNDTHRSPLTTTLWDGYSYIVEFALNNFFSSKYRSQLIKYSGPIENELSLQNAESLINNFIPMALRRPVKQEELLKILNEVKQSSDLESGLKNELKNILMSPRFMYRGLMMKKKPGRHAIDGFEMAERLSYFIWASMPDATLMQKAEAGLLFNKAELKKEIDRMIASPKSRNLADDFANQWMTFDEIDNIRAQFYPITQSMKAQATDFFNYLISEDRPLMELIDSKVTFANQILKNYYRPDVKQIKKSKKNKGVEQMFEPLNKINLENTPNRGGILTLPGILAMNSSVHRTSPILRGTWILERILGAHLPEPPMDIGQVAPNKKGENLTFRERFEAHKSNKTCAVCHDKIDPLGFGLEGFDAKGYDRLSGNAPKKKKKKHIKVDDRVDASGVLYGKAFKNFNELKTLLLENHREAIIRNIVRKTMSYSLARDLEYFDSPTIEAITQTMLKTNGTYKQLFLEVATSISFTQTINQEN